QVPVALSPVSSHHYRYDQPFFKLTIRLDPHNSPRKQHSRLLRKLGCLKPVNRQMPSSVPKKHSACFLPARSFAMLHDTG
ncbi:hypothetical protein P4V23_27435, partial [Brevibacillus agri]|uniref:hypothetical protein n=1 Tax=Brevibacillus agri TaxID=51101 RepID=UPI002E1E5CC5|nr:hypothetical protein [Brevibacillus agri]